MNIRDIAKLAGVSASTVSKVMNGKDKDISDETKRKVLKVIEEEDYVPYLKFREKEGLKNKLIGLVVRKDNRERENIVLSTEKTAGECGYGLIVSYAETTEEIQQSIEKILKKNVSGLLIDSREYLSVQKLADATIYFSQTKKFDDRQKSTFYYRLSEAGKLAAERLIKAGHEKIACLTFEGEETILDGYRTAMQNANFMVQPLWCYTGKTISEIEQYGIKQCVSGNVTAVICGTEEIAVCFCKAMERTGTIIPEDMSVIVIGDGAVMEIIGDGLTAVKLPTEAMCKDAVRRLVEIIQGEKQIEVTRYFSPGMTERNSIACPAKELHREKIVVVGSMNMDVTTEVSRIPINGETQLAERLYVYPGGKGGNQAVGAGKLGGQVYMIGCLGNDLDGKEIYSGLVENRVHMDGVLFDSALPSGKAYINVDKRGESTIVVYQGANRKLSIDQINRCKYLFQHAKYCLLSLEIPEAIFEYTIKLCRRTGTAVILKPSAADHMKEELFKDITYFVPNEHELHTFVPGNLTIEEKAQILREKGIGNVIVTLGSRGCYLNNKEESVYFEGSGFEAVDTTGGADSFISALAVYLSEGKSLVEAISFAVYASGLSVTRYGVQPALPQRKELDIYEEEIYSKYHR